MVILLCSVCRARFLLSTHVVLAIRGTLVYLSQRPTHSGSIFRLLLKIAVGLPRSCDSSQFLQGFGPNRINESISTSLMITPKIHVVNFVLLFMRARFPLCSRISEGQVSASRYLSLR